MNQKDAPDKPYLTTKQASQLMGLSEEEVRSRCRTGELAGAWQTRDNEGPWQIPQDAVDAWLLLHKPRHDLTSRLRVFWTRLNYRLKLAIPLALISSMIFLLGALADATDILSSFFGVDLQERKAASAPMQGDYNVAVAGLQVIGSGSGMESATELANNIANAIDREIAPLEQQMDQRIEIRLPSRVGVVRGNSERKRAEQAGALAQTINAHMVIYGVVEVDGASVQIKPEFYIRSDGFSEAAEITGPYRIGSPVPIENVENIVLRREASSLIKERFRALTFVIYGLADMAAGNYDEALTSLQRTLEIKAWDNPDVLYVLLGNAALKSGDFDQANRYYQAALTENTAYARAYVGLGSTFYMAALGNVYSDTYDSVDMGLLDQAIEHYEKALDGTLDRPPLADVPTKAQFALGQCYLLKAGALGAQGDSLSQERYSELAIQAFQAVIEDFAGGQNARVQELAAHAHAHLGLVHHLNGAYEAAIAEYHQAVSLLPPLNKNLERRAMYEAAVAEIYLASDQSSQAIEWYQRAVDHSPPDSDQRLKYHSRLEALR